MKPCARVAISEPAKNIQFQNPLYFARAFTRNSKDTPRRISPISRKNTGR